MYGKQIKMHRIQRKITQIELSKATNITQQCLSLWEKDERIPNIDGLVKIADFYGISLDELIGRDIKKNW